MGANGKKRKHVIQNSTWLLRQDPFKPEEVISAGPARLSHPASDAAQSQQIQEIASEAALGSGPVRQSQAEL